MFDINGVSLKRNTNDGIPREDILKGYKHYFGENEVFEENELKSSEPETSELQILCESVSKALKTQALSSSESDTLEPHTSNKEESKVPELSILNSPEPENSFVQNPDESEAETSKSEALMKPDKRKMKAKVHGCLKCKQTNAQVLKGSESKTQESKSLINSEPKCLNVGTKGSSLPKTKLKSRPKNHIPKVLNKAEFCGFNHNSLTKKRPARTNQKGPIKIWVPKNEIVLVAGVPKRKDNATFLVPGQWLLASHDRRQVYVPNPEHARGRLCGFWRKPEREDSWYWYDR